MSRAVLIFFTKKASDKDTSQYRQIFQEVKKILKDQNVYTEIFYLIHELKTLKVSDKSVERSQKLLNILPTFILQLSSLRDYMINDSEKDLALLVDKDIEKFSTVEATINNIPNKEINFQETINIINSNRECFRIYEIIGSMMSSY